jgi:ABC-type lipoprotein release transport system permease subunit
MAARLETLAVVTQIALRNLFASRLKTLIVGGIIFFGSFLVVVGSSLLDSIDAGMRQSIVGSLAGHLQVYSDESKEELALYGGMTGETDIEPMPDFSKVKQTVLSVPNVKAIVPMGSAEAMVGSGNDLDLALERLRDTVRARLESPGAREEEYRSLQAHVRKMIGLLRHDLGNAKAMIDDKKLDPKALATLDEADSDAFWAAFDEKPLAGLERLENEVAPLSVDGDMLWVRYVGTDLDAFQKAFDRMEIVEGTPVPKGQRGILLGKLYAEEFLKLKTARRLDKIREALASGKKIAGNEELQRFVRENTTQVRDIVMQLDPVKERVAVERLQKSLGSSEADAGKLLAALLQTDDANFQQRYQIFYEQLAPLLQLYRLKIGDTITLKAASKSGYFKSVNVKIYGTYQFRGLGSSSFAGMLCLMDLMTFRDLYGHMTPDKRDEIKELQAESGAKQVARENAEAELFGSPSNEEAGSAGTGFDESAMLQHIDAAAVANELLNRVYTQAEIDSGVALSSAVILSDPSKLEQTRTAILAAAKRDGLPLRAVDWQKASGMIGQFISLSRGILYSAVAIIFLVALVIINNAMVMATLQRVKEIGTLRAIGAQKRFVLSMLITESVAIGLLFGLIGALCGAGLIGWLGHVGIPAGREQLYFFFSGPRLFPFLGGASLAISLSIVVVVSILSSLYPAWLAMRITPVEAMSTSED